MNMNFLLDVFCATNVNQKIEPQEKKDDESSDAGLSDFDDPEDLKTPSNAGQNSFNELLHGSTFTDLVSGWLIDEETQKSVQELENERMKREFDELEAEVKIMEGKDKLESGKEGDEDNSETLPVNVPAAEPNAVDNSTNDVDLGSILTFKDFGFFSDPEKKSFDLVRIHIIFSYS